MIHFLIVTLGCRDLLELAVASIDKYAGECMLDIVDLPADTTDPVAHGRAIDFWRQRQKIGIRDTDLVCVMDPDVILLNSGWRAAVDTVFMDHTVGIWGAGMTEDFGPRVHASLMVIRGLVFNTYEYSFVPVNGDPRWRDTGGNYCRLVAGSGWRVVPKQRGLDWHGVSAWGLWAHLGGGSHSDWARLTWRQRLCRWPAIRQRWAFMRAARTHLREVS